MQSNRLKHNADKTECIWLTTWQRQSPFAASNLTVGGSIIIRTKGTRNLGVFVDNKLDVRSHVSNICRTCYFRLRQLRTVRRSLQPKILKALLHPVVSWQLDYCNSLYVGLLACDIAQLQSVQNAVARLLGGASKYDSVTPVLRDVLHWLPIKEVINFKIGVLINKARNRLAPSYLSETLGPVAVNPALLRHRSANCGDITVPRAKNTSYDDRSFAITAPMLWKSFSVALCCISSKNFLFAKDLRLIYLRRCITSFLHHSTDRDFIIQ